MLPTLSLSYKISTCTWTNCLLTRQLLEWHRLLTTKIITFKQKAVLAMLWVKPWQPTDVESDLNSFFYTYSLLLCRGNNSAIKGNSNRNQISFRKGRHSDDSISANYLNYITDSQSEVKNCVHIGLWCVKKNMANFRKLYQCSLLRNKLTISMIKVLLKK